MIDKSLLTKNIKQKASELGFLSCGISKARYLEEERNCLEDWLSKNNNGKMDYMANNIEKRLDPTKLLDDAKSVISLSYNYYSDKTQHSNKYKISKYAYGIDYHYVIKDKLKILSEYIFELLGTSIALRIFVDSAPVMEKTWAKNSGIGWIGKNSNLITKKIGSFFFLSEIILDLDLIYDIPTIDYCGKCSKCIDMCPTQAIEQAYKVNASKCISYLTIELKDEIIPSEFRNKMENWVFGCDICMDVCPWNRFSSNNNEILFTPNEKLINFNNEEWEEITKEVFDEIFKKSPVKRTKYNGFLRNINFIKQIN